MELAGSRYGALVAIAQSTLIAGHFTDAVAIARKPDQDKLRQRMEVMDFFRWSNRARAVMCKLKWKFTVSVD